MAQDDWRVRIEMEEERHATDFLARLGLDLGSEARELAKDLEEPPARRVERRGHRFRLRGHARRGAQGEGDRGGGAEERDLHAEEIVIEHWLADEERWDDEAPAPDTDEELLKEGYAPWEVRIERESVDEAHKLADELEKDGYGVVRRAHYVIAGTATKEDAEALAARLHGEVEPGGELVYEVQPDNPFVIFGGLGT